MSESGGHVRRKVGHGVQQRVLAGFLFVMNVFQLVCENLGKVIMTRWTGAGRVGRLQVFELRCKRANLCLFAFGDGDGKGDNKLCQSLECVCESGPSLVWGLGRGVRNWSVSEEILYKGAELGAQKVSDGDAICATGSIKMSFAPQCKLYGEVIALLENARSNGGAGAVGEGGGGEEEMVEGAGGCFAVVGVEGCAWVVVVEGI